MNKKEKNKIIEEVRQKLTAEDELLIIMTEGKTIVLGTPVEMTAAVLGLLRRIKDSNILGEMAVEVLIHELKNKAEPEELTDEETDKKIDELNNRLKNLLKTLKEEIK